MFAQLGEPGVDGRIHGHHIHMKQTRNDAPNKLLGLE